MEYSKEILENYRKYNHEEETMKKKMIAFGKKADKFSENELEKITMIKKKMDVIYIYIFILKPIM